MFPSMPDLRAAVVRSASVGATVWSEWRWVGTLGEGCAVGDAEPAAVGLGRFLRQERFDRLLEVVRNEGFLLHAPDDATSGGF